MKLSENTSLYFRESIKFSLSAIGGRFNMNIGKYIKLTDLIDLYDLMDKEIILYDFEIIRLVKKALLNETG